MKPQPWNPPFVKPKRKGWYDVIEHGWLYEFFWNGLYWWRKVGTSVLLVNDFDAKWRGPARKSPRG